MNGLKKLTIFILICCLIAPSVLAKATEPNNQTASEVKAEQTQESAAETNSDSFQNEENAIELDLSGMKQSKVNKKSNKSALNKGKNYTLQSNENPDYLYNERDAYQKRTSSYKKSKKFKNGEVGAKYDTTISPESATQTRTLYTKYNLNSKTSVNASYKNNTMGTSQSQNMKGTVSVSPEYRINKKLSVQNDFSKNMNDGSTKEGVSVKINPLKDKDRMDIQVGAGQVQYQGGPPPSSQINFGTNIRF